MAHFIKLFWPAVAAASLTAQTFWLTHKSIKMEVLVLVFCGTVFGYNFFHNTRVIRQLSWIFGSVSGIFFLGLNATEQLIALLGVFHLLCYYGFSMQPQNKGIRAVLALKPITIGLTWALLTAVIVHINAWILLERSAFVAALALAYDLVDIPYDRRENFNTLATKLGRYKALSLVYICLGIALGATLLNPIYTQATDMALSISICSAALVVTALAAQRCHIITKKWIIDGLMVLQATWVYYSVFM